MCMVRTYHMKASHKLFICYICVRCKIVGFLICYFPKITQYKVSGAELGI